MSARIPLRALAAVALVLALLAALAGSPTRSRGTSSLDAVALAGEIEHEEDHVTARELAEWIRADKPGLRVLDVRSDSEFARYHIPSAEHVSLQSVASRAPVVGETLVLYSEGGAHGGQAWVLLRALGFRDVYFLAGGLLDWLDDVMSPTLGTGPDAARAAALSRYFGGTPRAEVAAPSAPRSPEVVARMRRRGC